MKYKIEGNIDFFNELHKSLDQEEPNTIENVCLITDEPLIENFVKMECGHCFNYLPLYYDIYNHKKKFNSMETNNGHLKINEIRCPYCRNKQTGVLPYYPEFNLEKINGVNTICEVKATKTDLDYVKTRCNFIFENSGFNPELPESTIKVYCYNPHLEPVTIHNVKYLYCSYYGTKLDSIQNYGDEKCYCYYHKKHVISKYKKNVKEEAKQSKIQAKILEKEAKNQAKMEEKEAKVQGKLEAKKSKMQHITSEIEEENVVIHTNGCTELLKIGPNKGQPCKQKIFQEGVCKRHYQKKK